MIVSFFHSCISFRIQITKIRKREYLYRKTEKKKKANIIDLYEALAHLNFVYHFAQKRTIHDRVAISDAKEVGCTDT